MKKIFISAFVAVAGMMAFTACDPSELLNEISGDATVTVAVANADSESFYTDGQTLDFTSCLTDNLIDDSTNSINAIFLAAHVNLMESTTIEAPYMGWSINDTVPGNYTLQSPFNADDILTFNPESLLTHASGTNMLVIMASENAYYVAKGGQISLTTYPSMGKCATGSFDNIQCYYVPGAKVDYLKDQYDAAMAGDMDAAQYLSNLNLDEYFETITINGNFNGRRIAIEELLNSIAE